MRIFDIVLVRFVYREDKNKSKNRQRSKYRPAIVVNKFLSVKVAQITGHPPRTKRDYVIEHWKESGLDKPSTIRFDVIMEIPDKIIPKTQKIGRLSGEDIKTVVDNRLI